MAIGGISAERIAEVVEAGADGIAVIGAAIAPLRAREARPRAARTALHRRLRRLRESLTWRSSRSRGPTRGPGNPRHFAGLAPLSAWARASTSSGSCTPARQRSAPGSPRALGRPFLDLDRQVEEEAGRSDGRDLSRPRARRSSEGGSRGRSPRSPAGPRSSRSAAGPPLRPSNRALLARTGSRAMASPPFEVIWSRAKGDRSGLRPLWRDERSLRELYAARERSYAFAHLAVDLEDGEPEAAVEAARRDRSGPRELDA